MCKGNTTNTEQGHKKTLKLHVRSWFKHSNFPEKGLVSSHGSKPQLVKSATRDQL